MLELYLLHLCVSHLDFFHWCLVKTELLATLQAHRSCDDSGQLFYHLQSDFSISPQKSNMDALYRVGSHLSCRLSASFPCSTLRFFLNPWRPLSNSSFLGSLRHSGLIFTFLFFVYVQVFNECLPSGLESDVCHHLLIDGPGHGDHHGPPQTTENRSPEEPFQPMILNREDKRRGRINDEGR